MSNNDSDKEYDDEDKKNQKKSICFLCDLNI